MDHYEKLNEAVYAGNNLGQRKGDYGDGSIFYGLFLAPEMKLRYIIDKMEHLEKN